VLGNNLVNAKAATLVSVIAIELFGGKSGGRRRELWSPPLASRFSRRPPGAEAA
jgi:hypothetical protein